MAYRFEGVLIVPCSLTEEEVAALFEGYARRIRAPFAGVLVPFKNESTDIAEVISESNEIRDKVLICSQKLPQSRIVCLSYVCWGGDVDYCWGFACQNGVVLGSGELEKQDDEELQVLRTLLEFLGAELPESGFFAPFERDFFPNT